MYFFPALSLFQRSTDIKAQLVSLRAKDSSPSDSIAVISLIKLLHHLPTQQPLHTIKAEIVGRLLSQWQIRLIVEEEDGSVTESLFILQ